MLANPDAALVSVVPSTVESLRLLTSYIGLLIHDPPLMEGAAELRRLAVSHVHCSEGSGYDAPTGRSPISCEVARNVCLDGAQSRRIWLPWLLELRATLRRSRLDVVCVRKLFEGESTSLSQFVLGQRLTRVHRMLAEPRYAVRTISDIALAVGFGDISTFNHEFRRRFKVTPSDVRAAARKGVM
jgi:AraC-like DNA-binding protein